MKFCSHCAHPVDWRVPAGDTLPRHVCANCDTVHYVNPKLVVGAIVEYNERVLLCRRAIEPRLGFWTLPAGFMENGESTAEGAARETLEEACAHIEVSELFTLIDVPHINQVHLIFRARLIGSEYAAGDESLEVALVAEHEIPWDELAFRTNSLALRHYFDDRRAGRFGFHRCTLGPAPQPVDG
ncbi:NUDIX hydrolase [Pseudazoarcus pumilus]|uniref:NUDIX hydrolase n=1 Tax=Pseudazoarcus pumilus TaxID=2067960 RepID=A0A2I6S553_9RHOO|nr:NUDIX hydrolase [Pseudazoarcus pumilus]AUN94388.1 NUDIX hydrolase [Pseudazoarcus pumilus]